MRAVCFIGILCCALVFGLTLSQVLQAPGSRGLDVTSWLAVQHSFNGGFAVVGGLAEIIELLAAATDAFLLRSRASAADGPLIAAACLLGTLLANWFGNRPINAKVAAWTPTTVPGDWPGADLPAGRHGLATDQFPGWTPRDTAADRNIE